MLVDANDEQHARELAESYAKDDGDDGAPSRVREMPIAFFRADVHLDYEDDEDSDDAEGGQSMCTLEVVPHPPVEDVLVEWVNTEDERARCTATADDADGYELQCERPGAHDPPHHSHDAEWTDEVPS